MPENLRNNKVDPFRGLGIPVPTTEEPTEKDPFGGLGIPVQKATEPDADPFGGLGVPADTSTPSDTYTKQRQEVAAEPWYGNWGATKETTEDDIKAIAQKHGVDAGELRSIAPFLQARMETGGGIKDAIRYVEGLVGEGVLLGLPQKALIKLQEPKMSAAMDDLRQLAEARKGGLVRGAELVMPGQLIDLTKGVVGGGKNFAAAVATGAATGAASNIAQSRTGEEFDNWETGAAIGALGALPFALLHLKAAKGGSKVVTPEVEEAISKGQKPPPEVQEEAASKLAREAPIDATVEKVLRGETPTLDELATAARSTREPIEIARYQKILGIPENAPEEQLEAEVGKLIVDNKAKQFLLSKGEGYLTSQSGESIPEAVQRIKGTAHLDPERLTDSYKLWNKAEAEMDVLTSQSLKFNAPNIPPWMRAVQKFVSDFQMLTDVVDRKLGTHFNIQHRKLVEAVNEFTIARRKALADLPPTLERNGVRNFSDLTRKTQEAGLTGSQVSELIEFGKTADGMSLSSISSEQRRVVDSWRNLWEHARTLANTEDKVSRGLSIPFRENYVPSMAKSSTEVRYIIRGLISDLERQYGKLADKTDAQLHQLSLDDHRIAALADTLGYVAGKQRRAPLTQELLRTGLEVIESPNALTRTMMTKAAATYARDGGVPQLIREMDAAKVYQRWVTNTLRHKYLRSSLEELGHTAKLIDTWGDKVTASKLSNLISDMSGQGREKWTLLTAKQKQAIQDLAIQRREKATNSITRSFYSMIADDPNMLNVILNQAYPNLLGWSPRAVLKNLTQVPSMVGARLGGTYGGIRSLQGLAAAINPREYRKIERKLSQYGLEPETLSADMVPWVMEGIKSTALGRISKKVLDGQAQFGMYFYSLSDKINRVATYHVAQRMVQDLASNNKQAVKALSKQPVAVQKLVRKLVTTGKLEEAERELGASLISLTQFHYNRAAMSEMGRTLGPMFSMFSKWPTSIAGDALAEIEGRGLREGGEVALRRWVAPIIGYLALDQLIHSAEISSMDVRESDRAKLLIGSRGLVDWAPGMSAGQIGTLAMPLAVDTALPLIWAPLTYLEHQDTDKFQREMVRAAGQAGSALIPGAGLARFFARDFWTLATGEDPGAILEQTGLQESR